MFKISDSYTINMTEGDFGITLPIELELEGVEQLTADDTFTITIYEKINTEPLITKTYNNIENNTIELKLTKEDSLKLKADKTYYYDIDWTLGETFLNNILAKQKIKIDDKAGVVDES